MTQQIYHPKISGGLTQISLDEGNTWIDLRGVTSLDSSGGEREEEEQESIDEGVSSEVGPPRPKDIAIAINPSVGAAGYQAIQDAYYSEKPVKIRFTTKAEVKGTRHSAKGGTASEFARVKVATLETGFGKEAVATFTAGSDTENPSITVEDDGPFLNKLHRGLVIGTAGSTREYIIDSKGTAALTLNVSAADPSDDYTTAQGNNAEFVVVEYGVRIEWDCNVINADVNSLSPGARFADALALKQTSATKFIKPYWNPNTQTADDNDFVEPA